MECQKIYERIENLIYRNKFVVLYSNNQKEKDYVNENLRKLNYNFIEITIDEKDLLNYEECVYKKYANDNNQKMIFKNTNEYDSNNSFYKILFPMIFINGMNIGGFNCFKEMVYRREIDKF